MSEWIEDLKKIKAREEAEDLNPDEVLELHIEAFIRDYARKKMADGSPCPCCGARQRVKAAGKTSIAAISAALPPAATV